MIATSSTLSLFNLRFGINKDEKAERHKAGKPSYFLIRPQRGTTSF